MMKFWKWSLRLQKSNKINFIICFSKDLRAYLPAIFFAAIFLFQASCRKPEDLIDLGVQPPGERIDAAFSIGNPESSTLGPDSIRTDQTVYNLAGSSYDPVFGKAQASFYSQVRLLTSNVVFSSASVVDSIVLTLKYHTVYGNSSTPQTFRVYEITQALARTNSYYSNSAIGFSAMEIGSIQNFIPSALSSQINIKLNNDFGQSLLNADPSHFVNNESFLNFFKGFYVKPDVDAVPGNGSILSFDLLSADSKMTLYYKDTVQKTFDFVINENSVRVNNFNLDYTGSEVATALADPNENQKLVYVQSMGGVRTKIKLPDLTTVLEEGNLVINKAEFIIKAQDDNLNYPPPARLRIVAIDSLGRFLEIPDFFEGSDHYGGIYNATTKEYRFNIGRHLLYTLKGKPNYDLLLLPSGSAANANRVVLYGGAAEEDKRMRLQITYTKL